MSKKHADSAHLAFKGHSSADAQRKAATPAAALQPVGGESCGRFGRWSAADKGAVRTTGGITYRARERHQGRVSALWKREKKSCLYSKLAACLNSRRNYGLRIAGGSATCGHNTNQSNAIPATAFRHQSDQARHISFLPSSPRTLLTFRWFLNYQWREEYKFGPK